MLSSGQMCHYPVRASESKYGKFAYSSAFGYSVPTGGYFVEAIGGDNILALTDEPAGMGETWKVRRVATNVRIEEYDDSPTLVSGWKPYSDVSVETYLLPPTEAAPNWHLRVHHVTTGRALRICEGAFALYGTRESDGRPLEALNAAATEGTETAHSTALAVSRAGAVGIVELGSFDTRRGRVLDADANSNLVDSRTVLPSLLSELKAGDDVWYVTAVFAIPASVQQWHTAWPVGWTKRPTVPGWLQEKMK